jgi:hypothetical protein
LRPAVVFVGLEGELAAAEFSRALLDGFEQGALEALALLFGPDRKVVQVEEWACLEGRESCESRWERR